jgi:hypothetical protein
VRVFAVVAFVVAALTAPTAAAQEDSHAGIYVRTGEDVASECVAFSEDEITGEQLLERSSFEAVLDRRSLGTAVCRLDGVGCGADDCFCEYPSFWGYWTRAGDEEWMFSDVGAADRTVRDGSVDGWSFGRDGKPAPPEGVTFAEICGQTSALPTVDPARGPDAAAAPNYLPFVAIAGLLVVAAILLALRRRRPTL